MIGTSNLGSWNGHWLYSMGENKPKLQAMELLSCVAEQGDDDFVKEPTGASWLQKCLFGPTFGGAPQTLWINCAL